MDSHSNDGINKSGKIKSIKPIIFEIMVNLSKNNIQLIHGNINNC